MGVREIWREGACTASRLARPYPPARLAHRIDLELMTCVCGHWVGKTGGRFHRISTQDCKQKVIVIRGFFDFSFHGYLCRMSFQQGKRQFTNGGEVESGVFLWRLARVFARDDVGHPTQVVRKAPMGAGSHQNGRRPLAAEM
jgi:hypothetical protein